MVMFDEILPMTIGQLMDVAAGMEAGMQAVKMVDGYGTPVRAVVLLNGGMTEEALQTLGRLFGDDEEEG